MSKSMKFLTAVLCAFGLTACETVDVINVLDDGFIENDDDTTTNRTVIHGDPELVHLNGYTYDLLDGNPDIPRDMRVAFNPNRSSWQIVQFKQPLSLDEQNRLIKGYGLSLNKYVRNSAYVEYLTPGQGRDIEGHKLFRARGAYHTAFKIAKKIGQREFATEERRAADGLRVYVKLWPNGEMTRVANAVQALDGSVKWARDDRRQLEINGGYNTQTNPRRSLAQLNRDDYRQPRMSLILGSIADVEAIARLDDVEWVEEYGEITPRNKQSSAVVQTGAETRTAADTPFYNNGIRGDGQIIGHIDSSIDISNRYFNDPAMPMPGATHRKIVRHTPNPTAFGAPAACGASHGTHTAGTAAGNGVGLPRPGVAMNARLSHSNWSRININSNTGSFINELARAYADGARVFTNSWGDNAPTNVYSHLSADADTFSWRNSKGLVVLASANGSPGVQSPPDSAKNGLTVGASASPPFQLNHESSSAGPVLGRRKPEIFADGLDVDSAQAGTLAGTIQCTGTSMATPVIAGAAALVRQYFMQGFYPTGAANPAHVLQPSGALVKAVLLNSTRDMTGTDRFRNPAPLNGYPTNLEGWGLAVLDDTVYFAGDPHALNVWDVPRATGIGTGGQTTYSVWVQSNAPRLKVTLAWMDSPPTAGTWGNALMPVNNNLDLIVQAPDGTLYYGNHYGAGAQSAPGGAADKMNNVEQFERSSPQPGPWKIHVRGTAVNQGPLQGYALVASGNITGGVPPVVGPAGGNGMIVTRTSTGVCKSDHYKFEYKQGGAVLDTLKTSELDLPEVYCEVDDKNRHQIIKKPFKSRDKYITFAVAADDKGRSVQLHTIVYTAAGGMQDGVIEISAEPYNSRLVSGSRQLQRISNISISDTDVTGQPCGMACVTFTVSSSVRDITIAGSAFGKDANNDPNAGGRYQVKISNSGAVTAVSKI